MKPRKQCGKTAFNHVDIHVGKRIKTLRKLRRMSQVALADAVGLTFQQIQKYERGANRIGASRLFEFSQILDVPVTYFFDDMPPELSAQPTTRGPDLDTFDSPEVMEAMNAFVNISNPSVRQAYKDLAKELSTAEPFV